MRFKEYLKEDRMPIRKKMILDRLKTEKEKKEYLKAWDTHVAVYEKISKVLKPIQGAIMSKYNMSTMDGTREYYTDIKKALHKAFPKTFTDKQIMKIANDKASVGGYGNFSFNNNMDMWDYLAAVVMKKKGIKNTDDHKVWLKK